MDPLKDNSFFTGNKRFATTKIFNDLIVLNINNLFFLFKYSEKSNIDNIKNVILKTIHENTAITVFSIKQPIRCQRSRLRTKNIIDKLVRRRIEITEIF
jgi:hypothetical protein